MTRTVLLRVRTRAEDIEGIIPLTVFKTNTDIRGITDNTPAITITEEVPITIRFTFLPEDITTWDVRASGSSDEGSRNHWCFVSSTLRNRFFGEAQVLPG